MAFPFFNIKIFFIYILDDVIYKFKVRLLGHVKKEGV